MPYLLYINQREVVFKSEKKKGKNEYKKEIKTLVKSQVSVV